MLFAKLYFTKFSFLLLDGATCITESTSFLDNNWYCIQVDKPPELPFL